MSTHVYDHLKVDRNLIMHAGGTISTLATDLKVVPETDRMLAVGLNGLSNFKTTSGTLSRTSFIGGFNAVTTTGPNAVALFDAAVSTTSVGGVKLFVTLTDGNVCQRFDEFFAVVQGNTTFPPNFYQLSTLAPGAYSTYGSPSSIAANAITNGVLSVSYNFPYAVPSHTVQVSFCVDWYGTADAAFGVHGSSPTISSVYGLTAPSNGTLSGTSGSSFQAGSTTTLASLTITKTIQVQSGPDAMTTSLRIENSPGTMLSLGSTGVVSIDSSGVSGGRLVLDNAGRLGVGQPLPQYTLDINGGINFTGSLSHNGSAVNLTGPQIGSYGILHNSTYTSTSPAQYDVATFANISALSLAAASGVFTVNMPGLFTITWTRWVSNQGQSYTTSVQQPWSISCTDSAFGNNTMTSSQYVGRDSQSRYFIAGDTFTLNVVTTSNLQLYSPTAVKVMFISG